MSALTLNEEQMKLLRLCLKHAEPLKPDWDKVAEEAELVSTSAASQRWGRLYKVLVGDEKSSTPSKAKVGASKTGGATSKQRKTPNKKAAAPKSSKTSEEDTGEHVDGKATTAQPAIPTGKKRAHGTDLGGSGPDDESPSKLQKVESEDD